MTATTETIVSLPVVNPETSGKSRTFTFMGKVDRVEGRRLIDWKSCSDPETFIRGKVIGFQPYLYALALETAGTPIDEVEYRLVTTPGIRFCGKDAERDAYEQRCIEWLAEKPGRVKPHTLILNNARLSQARAYLWECSKRILDSRRYHRWLPNENACEMWGRTCQYAPLCECLSEGADVDWVRQEGFENLESIHPELGKTHCHAIDCLTYTSLSALTRCEMYYFWRYIHGIRKRGDYSEALWLGSAMHCGLEAYAEGGLHAGYAAIDAWEQQNPALGDGVQYVDQQVARARAMVRAAAERWKL